MHTHTHIHKDTEPHTLRDTDTYTQTHIGAPYISCWGQKNPQFTSQITWNDGPTHILTHSPSSTVFKSLSLQIKTLLCWKKKKLDIYCPPLTTFRAGIGFSHLHGNPATTTPPPSTCHSKNVCPSNLFKNVKVTSIPSREVTLILKATPRTSWREGAGWLCWPRGWVTRRRQCSRSPCLWSLVFNAAGSPDKCLVYLPNHCL